MNRLFPIFPAILALFMLTACGDESKIKNVQQSVLNKCNGKTVQALSEEVLQNPVWGIEKKQNAPTAVTVKGTLAGDKLPAWVKEQQLMDVTFRFMLDAKTDKFNPADLDGFPSLSTPEGILQTYKALVCK